MVPLFLGLTAANLTLLLIVFATGLAVVGPGPGPAPGGQVTGWHAYHIALGIAAGLIAVAVHVTIYTYFMATSRWVQAAGDKANLPVADFAAPAFANKRRSFIPMIAAVLAVMATMFAGAAADPTVRPWWPGEVHMVLAALTIVVNLLCALVEYRLIRRQGALMDRALTALNATPGVSIQQA